MNLKELERVIDDAILILNEGYEEHLHKRFSCSAISVSFYKDISEYTRRCLYRTMYEEMFRIKGFWSSQWLNNDGEFTQMSNEEKQNLRTAMLALFKEAILTDYKLWEV